MFFTQQEFMFFYECDIYRDPLTLLDKWWVKGVLFYRGYKFYLKFDKFFKSYTKDINK